MVASSVIQGPVTKHLRNELFLHELSRLRAQLEPTCDSDAQTTISVQKLIRHHYGESVNNMEIGVIMKKACPQAKRVKKWCYVGVGRHTTAAARSSVPACIHTQRQAILPHCKYLCCLMASSLPHAWPLQVTYYAHHGQVRLCSRN